MRYIFLIALLLMTSATAMAQENKPAEQKPTATTQTETEKTKNEVDLMLEEAEKRGETIYAPCAVEDCGSVKSEDRVENGRALTLPKPAYPSIARMGGASGAVKVQIIIGEDGTVIAAAAISGHPLLFGVSVAAARESTFTPVRVNGQPVKVVGVVLYNFVYR